MEIIIKEMVVSFSNFYGFLQMWGSLNCYIIDKMLIVISVLAPFGFAEHGFPYQMQE